MTIKPKAADFDCFVDGESLRWNDRFGLKARWRAATLAKSASVEDLDAAAKLATKQLNAELSTDRVLVVRMGRSDETGR